MIMVNKVQQGSPILLWQRTGRIVFYNRQSVLEGTREFHQVTFIMLVCVGVKTGGSRVGGPELWVLDRWVTGDKGDDVYPGLGPLYGGNTLRPALFVLMMVYRVQS